MADSVRESILKNIKTTLEGVTVANGYATTLASVQRFQQQGQEIASMPTVIILEGDDDVDQEGPQSGANSLVTRTLNVALEVHHRQDLATDTKSASEAMNVILSDIQKVMQVDYQRGGHALDTNEVSVSPIIAYEGQPELESTMIYAIKYRHRRTDPTSTT